MKILDLTHLISPQMPVYPGTEPPSFTPACTLEEHGFREMAMSFYNHTGTHMDSPAHLFEDGLTLDSLPLEQFIGKGTVVDCSHLDNGARIELKELLPCQKELEASDFVLFYTGWSKNWGQSDYFVDYPVLTEDSIELLMKQKLKGIGIDAISVDPVEAKDLPNHKLLLGNNFVIIENLTNLHQLLGKAFTLSCLPLKIADADGSPVRAVALL